MLTNCKVDHPNPKNCKNIDFSIIYGRMAGSDAWKMFLWPFQDVDFDVFENMTPLENMILHDVLDYYVGSGLMKMFLWTMG